MDANLAPSENLLKFTRFKVHERLVEMYNGEKTEAQIEQILVTKMKELSNISAKKLTSSLLKDLKPHEFHKC